MNHPADQIAREIQQNGPMTLARFMELALFSAGGGYYERQQEIGQRGDFYTSVSVGSVFGELLAFQFARWTEAMLRISFIEAGTHQGHLAADILGWMRQNRPDLFDRVEYVLIEPSATRRTWQRETLEAFLPQLRWINAVEDLPKRSVHGVIFSNEFFDAAPMHRLGWDRSTRTWGEWRIIADGGGFSWQFGSLSKELIPRLPGVPEKLAEVLPDRFTVELSPWAQAWWRRAAESVATGTLLTLDYGLTRDEQLQPQRSLGTLRGYAAHRVTQDPLDNPGGQDITAHIDFSALQEAGEASGLKTDGLVPQSAFLTRIFAETQIAPSTFGEWNSQRVRQFQTLTHPDHLGRAFRVLVQSKVTGTLGP